MASINPYQHCPVYETASFRLRLVEESDAQDLLACYSDPASAPIFNKDNCQHDFICRTAAEVSEYIDFWLGQYRSRGFVRFSIVDRKTDKAVGTIEMFARKEAHPEYGHVGVLRIDLASAYEKKPLLSELLALSNAQFYAAFGADVIITKAIPAATERVAALAENGFTPLQDPEHTIMPYEDYYFK